MKKKEYDVVICGAGAAGLLFAYRLNQDPFFKNHSVLLIEAAQKKTNDRTWAFWEKQSGPLEEIVYHRWEQGLFNSKSHRQELHFQPYTYKMIRGIDFYNYIRPRLEKKPKNGMGANSCFIVCKPAGKYPSPNRARKRGGKESFSEYLP